MSELAWGKKFAQIHHRMHLNRDKPVPIPDDIAAELDAIDFDIQTELLREPP
jgi:recombinational DNA repair ATPase RecF